MEKWFKTIGLLKDPNVLIFSVIIFLSSFLLRSLFLDRIPHIGDQGRDYLVAWNALEDGTIPLQGIPSSIPRFSQGPANVWFMMLSFRLGGISPFSPPLLAGMVTSIGFVLMFLLLNKASRLTVLNFSIVLYLTTSPLLVQQSRMPFYLFAIPLFLTIYIWLVSKVHNLSTFFFATIGFGLLFQWELATAPLSVCIIYAWMRVGARWKQKIGMLGAGLLIGLIPQVIWDLQNKCAHLCTLPVWAGYRATSFFLPGSEHTVFKSGAIWTIGQGWLNQWQGVFGILGWVFLGGTLFAIYRWQTLRHNTLFLISLWSFAVLNLGIILHGHPSEAYFPPFVVIAVLLFSISVSTLRVYLVRFVVILLLCASFWQSYLLMRNQFYAPSIRDSLEARDWILRTSAGRPFQLMSYDPDARFESYLSYMRFLLRLKGVKDQPSGIRYVIRFDRRSELPILNAVVAHFGHIDIARKNLHGY